MAPPSSPSSPLPVSNGHLIILYASQTGNAMDVAERVYREAECGGCRAVDVLSMDRFNLSCLPDEGFVIFVVSTMGQGDPLDSMKGFWKYLLQKHLGARWLEGLHYAVFGLGDSGYQKYNFPAKKLDQRLLDLGAKQIIEKGLGDDQHPAGFFSSLCWKSFYQNCTKIFVVVYCYKWRLDGINYQVGDSLEILPTQNPAAIDAFIQHCKLDPECYITIEAKGRIGIPNCSIMNSSTDRIKLKTFVALTMDVASASPCRYFFEARLIALTSFCLIMSYFATAEREKRRLKELASPEGRDDLNWYNQKEKRTVLEVLQAFPSVQMPFKWLVQLTPPLKKRAFSISSSPLAHPNQIHLTVSIVSWLTPLKRKRYGLCSTWLAGLSPNKENLIPCWIRRGSLPRPLPSIPLVLIGPGTGCAPFRAFVEERATRAVANHGVLSSEKGGGFFVAFSRELPQKIYVQDKIKEQSARVMNMLCSNKVAIYIAGCSTKMPADVTAALEEVICQETGDSKESVSEWLEDM
ncbi:hypothetical protein PVAP13_9KG238100 [Panicum virgatum]|uniref:NADPH-dependent diflavin oxidoreductase 1 n=1 Tax=Panicum virgatum TaxID=38727 RepID=A0A8T0NQ35_PANVG|nr:hypothetical protein PVAP13_9KG238100 [Panicum virgatum]